MPRKPKDPISKARGRNGAPELRGHQIDLIVELINGFGSIQRPTWDHVVAAARTVTNRTYTRQGLSRHEAIENAYAFAVLRYRQRATGGKERAPRQPTEPEVTISRLRAEIDDLKRQINDYDARFLRYVDNARKHGLSLEQLNAPMLSIPKGQTDKAAGAGK